MAKKSRYLPLKGALLIAGAACAFLKAKEGSSNKDEILDRLQKLMDTYGPYPKRRGPPKGTPKKIPAESIEFKQARRRLKEKKKMRIHRSPEEHAKKGPAWVAWKRKIAMRKAVEAAVKFEQDLGEL